MVDRVSKYTAEEIEAAGKMLEAVMAREKVIKEKWITPTKDTFDLYEGGKVDETPFNILYSNTEILVPNVFSSAPKPIVRRRFGEMRADTAAKATERMIEYCMDTNLSGYPEFVEALDAAVLCAALPGQGQCRVRVVDQIPVIDYVQHDEFVWAYAKRWEDVPWISYIHHKTKSDVITEFEVSEEDAALITEPQEESLTKDKGPATLTVYEVWNKKDKMVHFLCESFPDKCIKKIEDPLHLRTFFPSGKPLRFLSTPVSTMPRSMYGLYKRQAEELNSVTTRIKRITQAIQVRGIYDGNLPEMANLFDVADTENSMTPASNPGGMAREGGLDRHIWMVPVDKLIVVLQQLFVIREQIKSTIYEIMGIGDILRGVSSASETASAQQIKDKWGSLRIKKSREKASAFVRWHIRAMAELAAEHTPEEIWAQATGIELMSSQQPDQPAPPENWGTVLGQLKNDLTRSYIIDIETNSTVDGDATEEKAEVTEFMNALGQSMPAIEGIASQGPEGHAAAKTLLVEICKRFRVGSEMQSAIMAIQKQPDGKTPEQEKAQAEIEKAQAEVQSKEEALKGQEEAVQQTFMQNKQQIDQLMQSLQTQQAALEKAAQELELERKAFEVQVSQAELDLARKELDVEKKVSDGEIAVAEKDMEIKGLLKDFEVKSAQTDVETKKQEAVALNNKGMETSLASIMEALSAQNAITAQLLQTLANPPKMVIKQTGPSTFERTQG
jgi:hypothetical protein